MNGTIAILGKLFGLLQQTKGDTMINLIGPIEVVAGDDLDLVLTVTDDLDARQDLTGAAITVRISTEPGGAAFVEKTIGSGVTLRNQGVPDTKGQADIAITSADLTRTPQLYWIEVKLVLGGKTKHIIEAREFTIKPAMGAVAP